MNYQSLLILGRQPALGLAELESLFGADKIQPINQAALVDAEPNEIPFSRLGGSLKLARVITVLDTAKWKDIEAHLIEAAGHHASRLADGKLKLGLSAYGFNLSVRDLNSTALSIKKALVKSGRSTRVVPNKELELNSAQVLHNKLTAALGWELLLVKNGSRTILAQTVKVQDIDAYAARDQARPMRDAKVGMLPPKLAQIIINLANPTLAGVVIDPFCGTGVLLQEALLMGFGAYGIDLEPRMIEYTRANLEWLKDKYSLDNVHIYLEQADATTLNNRDVIDSVASETYLGQPYSSLPPLDQLQKNVIYVNNLHEKFLKNLAGQIHSGTRICLAVPAWKLPHGFKHLPLLDHLEELGYTRQSFVHVKNDDLIYHREGQVVARELVVLNRK